MLLVERRRMPGRITPAAGSGCAAAEMASTGSTPASAAFASPLFAIEPTAVYSVAWTVGRMFYENLRTVTLL